MSRTLVTNESGFYSAPNLLPGPYEVSVALKGFSTAMERLELTVSAQVVVNDTVKVADTRRRAPDASAVNTDH